MTQNSYLIFHESFLSEVQCLTRRNNVEKNSLSLVKPLGATVCFATF